MQELLEQQPPAATVGPQKAIDDLRSAMIAELTADVLRVQDQLELVKPLVTQLLEALPASMDVLRSGVIDMLEQINEGIKEAGGERTEFVKGQLSVYIKQCIDEVFRENAETAEKLLANFKKNGELASQNLKAEYEEVYAGMQAIRKEVNRIRFPTWLKITIPVSVVAILVLGCTLSWQYASWKEAVYSDAYHNALKKSK
ncbi:hypothetical protein YA0783_24915 [Pseudomonas corrugata]|uniref:hypothetical protein n=1 Tax=Pseudomonas corrugata TaxID=47879 RepID=UPI0018E5B95B|nr:hypothetical protein [Pseudomonas corrugata]MBI6621534.1 hypothetical protein [Pseudomonas corrugata]MBI6694231.1 hypothetical protein [Pseudomonas corrugata]